MERDRHFSLPPVHSTLLPLYHRMALCCYKLDHPSHFVEELCYDGTQRGNATTGQTCHIGWVSLVTIMTEYSEGMRPLDERE